MIDDQGRTKKPLKPLDISPTIRREMHGNEPRVVEPNGWEKFEKDDVKLQQENTEYFDKSPFKYVELFAGIGGFRQALDQLGGECVFASEIDKHARISYEALYGDKAHLHGDITKIDAQDIPQHDVLVGGFPCFAKGTLITTSEGLKPIEEVKRGDKVLTHANEFKDVVVPMMKHKKGIYELKIQGSPKTFVTEEHPYYVREMSRKWNNELRKDERVWSEPKWIEVKDLQPTKHFVGFSENTKNENPHNLTKEEAWLMGRYIADGYVRNGKRVGRINSYHHNIIFCLGKHKVDDFKNKVTEYHVCFSENRTANKAVIVNERLCNLAILCGKGAKNKEFPSFLLDLPSELLESAIDGYLSGDGSSRKGVYAATSVSKKLIFSIGQAVQKVYKTPYSISFTKRPKTTVIEGRTVNQRDTWQIRFSKENRKQNNAVYIDDMLWMPVKEIMYHENWEGTVYNFEVKEDNSYVANNCTVHNCQSFSLAGKRLGFEDTRGTLFFEIARIAKHHQPKVLLLENVKGLIGHDKGNTLDVMIHTLNDIGYTIDFEVLNSKYFNVPQNRERIFIVAIRNDLINSEEWVINGTNVVAKGKHRLKEQGANVFNCTWPEQKEVNVRLRDVLEKVVDQKYYLSDEKVAKLLEQLEVNSNRKSEVNGVTCINPRDVDGAQTLQQDRVYTTDGNMTTLQAELSGRFNIIEDEEVRPVLTPDREEKRQNGRRFKENDEESFTITAQDRHGVCIGKIDNIIIDASQAKREGQCRIYSDVAPTLNARDYKEPRMVGNYGYSTHYRIRKLIPKECLLLQAFSEETFEIIKQAGVSDSQIYKQAGNAVTVNVVKAVMANLLKFLK